MKEYLVLLILALKISNILFILYLDCSEFEEIKEEFCQMLDPGDEDKICNMNRNNQCISTYNNCEDYTEYIKKDICESIIPLYQQEKKCVFRENKCVTESRTCSDFKTG